MITHRQRDALSWLRWRHVEFPNHAHFATVHLGENTVALLRKLIPLGLVTATKGGRGSRQFFAITDSGLAALKEAS